MSGRDRCDEVLRLIDDALAEYERDQDARPAARHIVSAGSDGARPRT